MIQGVLPDTFGLDSLARCLMIYDWERPIDRSWLDAFEAPFAEFGAVPVEGTGHLEKKKSHGAYKRVRKKLAEFLENAEEKQDFSVRIRSEETDPNDGFCPSDVVVSFGLSDSSRKAACVAVRESLVSGPDELIERVERAIFDKCGAFYGGAFDFPAAFGPDAYLVSLGAIPKGHKWNSNREYSARITRWRKNTLNRKLRPSRGYFREIYPINFVLETHLNMPFRDAPLSKFMEATGALRPFEFNEKMYRWDVPDEHLNEVREALEPSGLVLSSETEPLQIN